MPVILEILFQIRLKMLLGISLHAGLESVLTSRSEKYAQSLRVWQKKLGGGQKTSDIVQEYPDLVSNSARRTFLLVLEKGLNQGSPIDGYLQELQEEFLQIIENKFEKKLQLLPLKLMIPLILFILPAVVMLIIGPLLITLGSQI